MKLKLKTLTAMVLLVSPLLAAPAFAATHLQTITFDDLTSNTDTPIASGYAGLNWSNFYALDSQTAGYIGTGYDSGTMSGNNVAYNGYGLPASFSAITGQLNFFGAYLTSAWLANDSVEVLGLRAGSTVFDQTVAITQKATLFQFNFDGVDTVKFVSSNGSQIAFDNVQVSPVPEPETYALVGLGLVGLLLRRRSRTFSLARSV
ncbi:PEP-CTERM sorting domain-containing protein [Paludibacterium yongneupense]|uniref:PEP-CTERM sorting domain-containing protein n=1 Tax=Paludibacterium yongneupense TaxID=400061 RepID=UPI00040E997D|nr:PEP-CTERM sorting domain-containing protein [Paludibacterium yongneupense]